MTMKFGERWTGSNPVCLCTVLVECSGEIDGSNPQCVCGSVMKKVYSPPVFRYLDFLGFAQPKITPSGSRDE
jgi:hypothetical protein